MDTGQSAGLISRFLPRSSSRLASGKKQNEPAGRSGQWADNAQHQVRDLVESLLQEPRCLIVTGYQDFLSTMAMLVDVIEDLETRPAESIRIVFGTNTDQAADLGGGVRSVAEDARAYFLGSRGYSVGDLASLRAVLAMEAIDRGIVALRVYDPALAEPTVGRRPPMLHAKLFLGETRVLSGSANFSQGGLRRNLEYVDDVSGWPELAEARRQSAERFWRMGRDWTAEALEILKALVRAVSPEEAVARTVIEARGFTPWQAAGEISAGRPPQPFQADLVYEAAGTIHEHGFAFVEAPTGAGKTDIGKHLATVVPVSHAQTVISFGERADQQRLGALALIPASVLGNWTKNAPANFKLIKHSFLSRREEESELEEINRSVRSSAAMIVDESHRLSSRYLAPSARSLVFERSPAIWTACLSATLMGNQGLDGLLAFHEKRASIYVPPAITERINAHLRKVRERGALRSTLDAMKRRLAEQQRQEDLFESTEALEAKIEELESQVETKRFELRDLQEELAGALSPYVVRRQRDCIGESMVRDNGAFAYPVIRSHRRDAELSEEQARIFARIKTLAEAITTGTTLVSADPQRAAQTRIRFHDKSRIHIRNFLALLRSSVIFAREEWMRERDSEADPRGRASIGESLRRAERQNPRRLMAPKGALPEELGADSDDSPTQICDRIGRLLMHPVLDSVDEERAAVMREILRKHGHAVFLAERVGVLEVYARLLAGQRGRGPEVFVVAPGAKIRTGKKLRHLRSGAEAQEYFGLGGKHLDPLKRRAMFMTFQMAEGVNLQMASALGILGVTSDVKSLIQGLGRIDRIDSPHSRIHYYTFDLPGLVLSSDLIARSRVENIALLSGVGAEDLPSELVESAAGDLTDLVLDQIRRPRVLRQNNYFDLLEDLCRSVPATVLERVQMARPRGLWGAELCLLSAEEPITILLLRGQTGDLHAPMVHPPRLLALRERGGLLETVGDQAEAASLLSAAFRETQRRGRHHIAPRLGEISGMLDGLADALPQLTHWDIRPARTVSLLASLARFLVGGPVEDDGRALLGHLTLPTLEKLAEVWAHELDPFWIDAKQQVSQKSATGGDIPDYLGIETVEAAFARQPEEALTAVRERMLSQLERSRLLSEGRRIDVLDRVCVIFAGRRS